MNDKFDMTFIKATIEIGEFLERGEFDSPYPTLGEVRISAFDSQDVRAQLTLEFCDLMNMTNDVYNRAIQLYKENRK